MAYTVPKTAPVEVALLTTLDFERTYGAYGDGEWTLSLHVNGPGDGDGSDVAAVASGSTFRFTLPIADNFTLGRYDWQVWADHATEGKRVVERGTFEVVPGFLEGAKDGGTSTHASRMLALIEARLEDRPGLDAESYSIGGRSLSRIPIRELREMRDTYRRERMAELAALQAGVTPGVKRPIRLGF
jgi:hypothetical protein